jgi:hypothetical protein
MSAASGVAFRKCGLAHRAVLDEASALWLRRNDSHGFDLLYEFVDPNGRMRIARLGSHRTKAAAIADAEALVAN